MPHPERAMVGQPIPRQPQHTLNHPLQAVILLRMATSSLNITLPEPLKAYVEAQVESGAYGTPTDYVRELIRDDRDRHLARLEDRLLENMKSKPIALSQEDLSQGNFISLCRKKLQENE